MTLPNHYPLTFPYEDTSYLEALVQDYLEAMGEEVHDSSSHTLLIEYKQDDPAQHSNGEDRPHTTG